MSINREAALDEFVSKNLKLLTSSDFDRQTFKGIHRKFFYEKHANKHGMPSLSDTLGSLVQLLRKRGTPPNVILDMFDRLPVFRLVSEKLVEEFRRQVQEAKFKSALSDDQLETIRKVGAFEALEIQKGSEIEARKAAELRELERQIEEKRQEYDQLPSVLDEAAVEEPDFNPEAEAIRQWWERFYLRENPFRRKDGLDAIDRRLYDAVVLRTKPLLDALGLLSRNPEGMFGAASLLLGDYGFGKTTFIDYLSYYLATKNIAAIRITSGRPHADSSGFIDDFYVRLRTSLRTELKAAGQPQATEAASDDSTIDSQVVTLAQRLIGTGRSGLIVFLDDYHKHRSAFPAVYEFLGTLQILKDEFARNDVKCGFVVAGLPEWRRQIPTNSQMTGFLDGPIYEMPPITPESVTAVFNQRIAAFCYDNNPRELKLQYVKHIFQEAGKSSGYRDYLTRIVNELENNNYAIVNTPIEISEDKLEDVRSIIEADAAVRSSFTKLVFESKFKNFNREQVAKCVELLVQTSLQQGVRENDALFLDSKFYFGRLRDLGLIQKRREGSGKAFKWVIHYRLQGRLDQVQQKYNFGINDYLLKLYAYKDYGSRRKPAEVESHGVPLAETRKFLNHPDLQISKSARESIGVAFHAYEAALHAAKGAPDGAQVVQHCSTAFEAISNALFEIDGTMPFFQRAALTRVADRWQAHWFADETVAEFYGRTARHDQTGTAADATHVVRSLETIFSAVTDRMKLIIEDVVNPAASVGLYHNLSQHTQDELALFDRVRTDYFSTDRNAHFEYVKAMTDYLEERFRWFLSYIGPVRCGVRAADGRHISHCSRPGGFRQRVSKNSCSGAETIGDGSRDKAACSEPGRPGRRKLAKLPELSEDQWRELHERLTLYVSCKLARRSWYGYRLRNNRGMSVVKGKGPEDIASDVIVAVLECKDGKRAWNDERYPDFFDFIMSVADSKVSALVRSKENRETRRVKPVDDGDLSAEERTFVFEDAGPDQLVEDADWKEKFRKALAKELGDDGISLGLFDCLNAGFKDRSEIAAVLEIGVNDVYNAQKRLERKTEAVMKRFDHGSGK